MTITRQDLSLRTATELQRAFDTLYWSAPATRLGKQRHIRLHLVGAVGKLARPEDRREHGQRPDESVLREAIADLLTYSIRLADLRGYHLPGLYRQRLSSLAVDRSPDDPWKGNTLLSRELGSALPKGERS